VADAEVVAEAVEVRVSEEDLEIDGDTELVAVMVKLEVTDQVGVADGPDPEPTCREQEAEVNPA
jgi:hypothetical protein